MFSSCEDPLWVLSCTWKFIPGYDGIDRDSNNITPHYSAPMGCHSMAWHHNNDCIVHPTVITISSQNVVVIFDHFLSVEGDNPPSDLVLENYVVPGQRWNHSVHLAYVYIVLPIEMSHAWGYSRGYRRGCRAHPDPSSSNNVSPEPANPRMLHSTQATTNEF